ncbi:MAG TPA: cupin domain-containing protein [Terriglobales bacterium]|nr:cupin domain-containing protein [Terriglobales bacterium]
MKKLLLTMALVTSLVSAQEADKKQDAKKPEQKSEMKDHDMHSMPGHKVSTAKSLQWVPGPASLPPGAQMAVLEGDPKQPGQFTIRLKLPAGFKIKPHTHPAIEHVTVLSGEAHFGMGEKWDETKGMKLSAGDFIYMHPGQVHFAWITAETLVQVHGIGPWKVNYVNPADAPTAKK